MNDWLKRRSKRKQYGKLLCGGVPTDSTESSGQKKTQKDNRKSTRQCQQFTMSKLAARLYLKRQRLQPQVRRSRGNFLFHLQPAIYVRASSTTSARARPTKQRLRPKEQRPRMTPVDVSSARSNSTTHHRRTKRQYSVRFKDVNSHGITSHFFMDKPSRSRRSRPIALGIRSGIKSQTAEIQ